MKNGKKLTRQQRNVLIRHKRDPDKYLFIKETVKQAGNGSLNKSDKSVHTMIFWNTESETQESFDVI
jgi:hypothetical protein